MKQPRTSARAIAGLAALAVAASLPMAASASSSHATALPPGVKLCGTFNGPHWSYQGVGGTQYIAYTRRGASCATAMKWAPRLVSKRPQGAGYLITGGPSGWVCANSVVHFGICTQAVGGRPTPSSKAFAWAGNVKK